MQNKNTMEMWNLSPEENEPLTITFIYWEEKINLSWGLLRHAKRIGDIPAQLQQVFVMNLPEVIAAFFFFSTLHPSNDMLPKYNLLASLEGNRFVLKAFLKK